MKTDVRAGSDLQAALNAARPGDTLSLEAGAVFVGNFTLPVTTGAGTITIESSAIGRLVPGDRVFPADAGLMPKIISPNSDGTIIAYGPVSGWTLRGLEISLADTVPLQWDMVVLGGSETRVEDTPQDIRIDQCYIHANPHQNAKRGVRLNCRDAAILNSYISEFHCDFNDSQGVCGWNGAGPFLIENCTIEASAENIMFGGEDSTIPGLVATGITVRGNHLRKPIEWREGEPNFVGHNWYVKNIFEIKNGQDVLAEGNVLENCWPKMQSGAAFLLNAVDRQGTHIRRVVMRSNIIRNCQSGLAAGGNQRYNNPIPSEIEFSNNLFYDQRFDPGCNSRMFLFQTGIPNLIIKNNTCRNSELCYAGEENPPAEPTGLVIEGNIFGVLGGDWTAIGRNMPDSLVDYWPGAVWRDNLTVCADRPGRYPQGDGNTYVASWDAVPFIDAGVKDFRLRPGSAQYGVDFDVLNAATGYAVSGKRPAAAVAVLPPAAEKMIQVSEVQFRKLLSELSSWLPDPA